ISRLDGIGLVVSCMFPITRCLISNYTCYAYNASSVYNCSCNFASPACAKSSAPAGQCTDPTTSRPCLPGLCLTNATSLLGCVCPKGFFQTTTAAGSPYCAP
ncbi:unnamed protein product, partial [Closterium sp. NIES-54]